MTRNSIRKQINKILGDNTKGLHNDDHWRPVQEMFSALDAKGFDTIITGTKYEQDVHGRPCRKTWGIRVNAEGQKKPFIGRIVCAGVGGTGDPLEQYYVVAYVC
jgi:hypothetical protein